MVGIIKPLAFPGAAFAEKQAHDAKDPTKRLARPVPNAEVKQMQRVQSKEKRKLSS